MSDGQVTLLMAVHCHQPVGNFGFVFEDAYRKSYDPFLRVLEGHPGVRLALHYSGSLLDWLTDHEPGFLERLRALAGCGQIELLAGGYYEPILPLIPEADRQAQIARMRQALKRLCGAEASGLWLTERVWEPDLPSTLAAAGIRYTCVDANQFAHAKRWLPQALQVQDEQSWELLGCYATEYAGTAVTLFPASKRLRYAMPFQPHERTIEFLRRLRQDRPVAITFADDGEKFGLWPKTHQWVYEERWLDQFFSALEREQAWLRTETFQGYLAHAAPDGRVYLPAGSYEEMLEWSGGQFRNFFVKYAEADAMEQGMLRVSRQLAALREAPADLRRPEQGRRAALLARAHDHLYASQCNCAYWHGVFGGLYLGHLRRAVYQHLIAAEELARQAAGDESAVEVLDADGDGQDEARLVTPAMAVQLDPGDGGSLTEWSLFGAKVNLLDTLTRRPEAYHEQLTARAAAASVPAGAPASIHDLVGVKEEGLARRLIYDDHRRSALLDYGFEALPSLREVTQSTWAERRLWSGGRFHWIGRPPAAGQGAAALEASVAREALGGEIRKRVRLVLEAPTLECRFELRGMTAPVAALEFNLGLRDPRYLAMAGERSGADEFDITEPDLGVRLRLAIDPPATLYYFPIETVSESEEGLERTYQGLCVICCWPVGNARAWAAELAWTLEA